MSEKIIHVRNIAMTSLALGFFNDAVQGGFFGAGCVLNITNKHFFKLNIFCGRGNNTKDELLALWCLIFVANLFGIDIENLW